MGESSFGLVFTVIPIKTLILLSQNNFHCKTKYTTEFISILSTFKDYK